jgi:light-harvesting protein B-800-850 alpha chain
MNQGRIWCVVSPTVGLPLFLGAVAVTSLIVHTAILTHSSWYGPYVGIVPRAKTAMNDTGDAGSKVASTAMKTDAGFTINVAPASSEPGQVNQAVVITVTPNQALAAATPVGDPAPTVLASSASK